MNDSAPIVKIIQVKEILTKSNLPVSDYSVNPYTGCPNACRYCYASFMKRFTGHNENWGSFLDVKYWPAVKNPSKYDGKQLFLSSVTDPYNPMEEKYGRTRSLLEELKGCSLILSIQTKSDLVLRDLDLLKTFPRVRVGFSINTLDEKFKDAMDKAVSIERRLKAMEILHNEGISTTCFISPIFPGISDVKAIIERVKESCNLVWLENLNLRGAFKSDILTYIRQSHPDLVPLYDEIYNRGDRTYWQNLDKEIRCYAAENNYFYAVNEDRIDEYAKRKLTIINFFYHSEIKKSARKRSEKDA